MVAEETNEKAFSLETMEQDFIFEPLRKNNWNRTASAAQMGIYPSILWRKIKRLNLAIPKLDDR